MDTVHVVQLDSDSYYQSFRVACVQLEFYHRNKSDTDTMCGNPLFKVPQKAQFTSFLTLPESLQ